MGLNVDAVLKFRTAIVQQRDRELYTGVIEWVGGMRFETFPKKSEAIEWTVRQIADIRDSFVIVSTNLYWIDPNTGLIRFSRKEMSGENL